MGKYGMRKKHAVVRYHAEAVGVLGFGMIQKRWKCRGLVSCGSGGNAVTGIMREQQKMLQIRKRRGGRWQERFGL